MKAGLPGQDCINRIFRARGGASDLGLYDSGGATLPSNPQPSNPAPVPAAPSLAASGGELPQTGADLWVWMNLGGLAALLGILMLLLQGLRHILRFVRN